jgi:hypothetical protein
VAVLEELVQERAVVKEVGAQVLEVPEETVV